VKNLAVFAVAALLEIGGCFAFWHGSDKGRLRRLRPLPSHLHRHLTCLVVAVERHAPGRTDLIRAGVAVIGAGLTVGFAARAVH